jgi:rod shape-determining protein MreD
MRRVLTLIILTLLCFLLQTTLFSFHAVTGFAPNLVMILTMSFGLMRGRREGLLVGFFGGFLCDVFFSSMLGPYMLLYMLIGYANGFFHRNYLMEDVMLPVIIVAVDELVYNFTIYVVCFLLRNRLDFSQYFRKTIVPQTLYTVLITVFIYRVFVTINRYLKKKAEGPKKR